MRTVKPQESRDFKVAAEVREGVNGPMIVGHGAVFNRRSSDMGFVEQVDPGAFDKTLQEADVRGLANHDPNWILGRTKAGTMRLRTDAEGLYYEIDVNTADPDGQRALAKVQRGDWDGSSFSFQAIRDEWNWDTTPPERRLLEVALIDIGPVTFPAYPDSTATSRALEPIAEKVGRPVAELVTALASGEIRSLVTGGKMSTIETETDVEIPPEDVLPDDTEENRAAPETEQRAGKTISAANLAKLQDLHDSLTAIASSVRDLMDVAQTDAPSDSDVGSAADKDLEEDSARNLSVLALEVELRQRVAQLEAA